MAKLNCVVILGLVAAAISTVSALSEKDKNAIRVDVLPIILECASKFDITKEAVLAAKEDTDIDKVDSCVFACFLKKMNVINDGGIFVPEVAKAQHAKYIHDDETLKQLDGVSDTCTTVNDEAVSDGSEGCDRAKLLVGCMKKHKDIFVSLFKA